MDEENETKLNRGTKLASMKLSIKFEREGSVKILTQRMMDAHVEARLELDSVDAWRSRNCTHPVSMNEQLHNMMRDILLKLKHDHHMVQ